jgi:hypothetical protein
VAGQPDRGQDADVAQSGDHDALAAHVGLSLLVPPCFSATGEATRPRTTESIRTSFWRGARLPSSPPPCWAKL